MKMVTSRPRALSLVSRPPRICSASSPGNAARVPVVHGWHQSVIENIDVEMHPESVKIRLGDRGHRLGKGRTGAERPDLGEVNDGDGCARDVLVEEMAVVATDPVADERDILVPDQRPQAVQEGQPIAAPAAQREHRSEHDAAVAAQQDRKAALSRAASTAPATSRATAAIPRGFSIPVSGSRTPE